MRQRDELCDKLTKRLTNIASRPKEIKTIQEKFNSQYDIPADIANDYLTLRSDIVDATDFIVYMFANEFVPKEISNYFTSLELKKYINGKYKVKKLKFPICYKMIQVADDQWIGRISVQDLILLRDAQIINYNEHTQRTMERVVLNGTEHWRIALNRKAVEAIQESFNSNTYIPNTITLNLPPEANYQYDADEGELIINKGNDFKFDILDGYHRYIALSKIYNVNKNFDYNMELRIVQFDENKAKQFIWQEDQKTKMRRVDSEALNQSAIPNKIMARLNADPTFNLAGQISPNEGVINSGEFYLAMNSLYKDEFHKKSNELSTVLRLTEYYKRLINHITETDSRYTKKWDRKMTIAVTYTAYKGTPEEEAINQVNDYCQILEKHPELLSKYQRYSFNRKDFNKLDELMAQGR